MGVILGTVPGWEQDFDWKPGNRTYIAPGYTKADIPDKLIEKGEGHEYRMNINIEIYIFDSPCDCNTIIVTRRIYNINIIGIYKDKYSGGLEQWVKEFSEMEARELVSRTVEEMAGPPECPGCKQYGIDINSKIYIPPEIPENIIELIRIYVQQILDYLESIREIEKEYNFKYEDIKDKYNLPEINIKLG